MKRKIVKKIGVKSLLLISTLSVFVVISCQKTYSPAKDIKLISLFGDNMVLQQKQDIPIWGTAEPGGEVTVTLKEQQQKVIVDDKGNWKVILSPVPVGGPYELEISAEDTRRIISMMDNEVLLCPEHSIWDMSDAGGLKIKNYKGEITNANYHNVRRFLVENGMANTPQENFNSDGWKEMKSKNGSEDFYL